MKGRAIARWAFPLILLVLALSLAGCNPFSQGSDSSGETEQESASGTTVAQEPTTETTEAQGSASDGAAQGQGSGGGESQGADSASREAGGQGSASGGGEGQGSASDGAAQVQGSGGEESQGANSASGRAEGQGSASSEVEGQGSASGGGGGQEANSQGGGQQAASQNSGQEGNSSQEGGQQASAEGPGPRDVLLSYYEAQNARNWEGAYQLFSSQSKQKVSLEQYVRVFSSISSFNVKYSVVSADVGENSARLRITRTLTAQGESQGDEVVHRMVRQNGSWRLMVGDEQAQRLTELSSQLQQAGR